MTISPNSIRRWSSLTVCTTVVIMGLIATGASKAGEVANRVQSNGEVRVCIWPDYYGVSFRDPRTQVLSGIDIDLSAELAKDLKVRLRYVDSSFSLLIDDLEQDRCDVAMFAVGMLPLRKVKLSFSRPYLFSDIYGITTQSSRVIKRWEDIDQTGVVVGVQAGTFMEPVMKDHLKNAQLVSVKAPATRERELEAGRIDVFMTDYPYSRRLLNNADWARLISPPKPFFVLPYGYAVRQGDETWLATIDSFVARIQKDGRLVTAAKRYQLLPIVVKE